ncbi:MAG: hypothetical protein QW367_01050 [Candidatus Aenigmatarchaeota archaeon]
MKIFKKLKYLLFLPYFVFLGLIFYILFIWQEKSTGSFLSGKAMGLAGILMIAFYYTLFLLALFVISKVLKFIIKFLRK